MPDSREVIELCVVSATGCIRCLEEPAWWNIGLTGVDTASGSCCTPLVFFVTCLLYFIRCSGGFQKPGTCWSTLNVLTTDHRDSGRALKCLTINWCVKGKINKSKLCVTGFFDFLFSFSLEMMISCMNKNYSNKKRSNANFINELV